jgi:hypothetical protein
MSQYYIVQNGKQEGPYTTDQLQAMKLSKDNLVWCEGMDNWEQAGNIEELKSIFKASPPPVPIDKIPSHIPIKLPPVPPINVSKPPKDKKAIGLVVGIVGLFAVLVIIGVVVINQIWGVKNNTESFLSDPPSNDYNYQPSAQATYTENTNEQATNRNRELQEAGRKAAEEIANTFEKSKKADYLRVHAHQLIPIKPNFTRIFLGGLKNVFITVTNNSEYKIDEVVCQIEYVLQSGDIYKRLERTIYNLNPGQQQVILLPNSDRGTDVTTNLYNIKVFSLGLDKLAWEQYD